MKSKTPCWIATDLDGTLIHRHQPRDSLPATWRETEKGAMEPSSWIYHNTHTLLKILAQQFGVVPVTARDLPSFLRVNIPELNFEKGAVLANGAILLKPSSLIPDPEHDDRMEPLLRSWGAILNDLIRQIHDLQPHPDIRARLVASNVDWPAYLVVKAPDEFWSNERGQQVHKILQAAGLRTARLGREVQALPPGLSKRMGVEAFARRFCAGVPPLLGFGDSQEDLGFIGLAEFLAVPRTSPLAERLHDSNL